MAGYNVRLRGVREAEKIMRDEMKYAKKLIKGIVRTSTKRIRLDIIDEFHHEYGIDRNLSRLKKIRSRSRMKFGHGVAWFGGNDVSMRYVAEARRVQGGLVIKNKFYSGAFIRHFRSGGYGYFTRDASGSLVDIKQPLKDSFNFIKEKMVTQEQLISREVEDVLANGLTYFER